MSDIVDLSQHRLKDLPCDPARRGGGQTNAVPLDSSLGQLATGATQAMDCALQSYLDRRTRHLSPDDRGAVQIVASAHLIARFLFETGTRDRADIDSFLATVNETVRLHVHTLLLRMENTRHD